MYNGQSKREKKINGAGGDPSVGIFIIYSTEHPLTVLIRESLAYFYIELKVRMFSVCQAQACVEAYNTFKLLFGIFEEH